MPFLHLFKTSTGTIPGFIIKIVEFRSFLKILQSKLVLLKAFISGSDAAIYFRAWSLDLNGLFECIQCFGILEKIHERIAHVEMSRRKIIVYSNGVIIRMK